MDLLRRRNMMQGADGPVFVDWIRLLDGAWIDTGVLQSGRITFSVKIEALASLREDATITGTRNQWAMYQNVNGGLQGLYNNKYSYGKMRLPVNEIFCLQAINYCGAYYFQYDDATWNFIENTTSGQPLITFDNQRSIPIGCLKEPNGDITWINSDIFKYREVFISYDLQPTENNIKALKPCYYRKEYGLWDTVEHTFYGNASETGYITGGYDE